MKKRIVVDLAEVREQREREKRIDNFMNTLCDIYRIERNRLPEGLKAKVQCMLACPYDDLRQNLSDVMAVLIAIRSDTVQKHKPG